MAQENIDVTVELRDRLSAKAKQAEKAIQDLRDEVDKLDTALAEESASQEAAAASTDKQASATRDSTKATKESTSTTDRDTKSKQRNREETDRSTRSHRALTTALGGLSGAMAKASKHGEDFVAKFMSMIKVQGIVTAVTLAAQGIAALGAAGYAAVAGLAPLVGVLGALPALGLGLVTALGAVKLGMSGVGAAVKVLTDPTATAQKVSQALHKLQPAQRGFAIEVAKTKEATDGWKNSIAKAMLPQFATALRNIRTQFPTIQTGLNGAGGAMGYLAVQVSQVVKGWGDLDSIMNRSNRMIRGGLAPAAVALVRILHSFLVSGGPLAERFAHWIGVSATHLADVVAAGQKSGRLGAFLNRAGDLAAKAGRAISNIAVGLFNIGKASGSMSGFMGKGFMQMTQMFRDWSGSASGQKSITAYFQRAIPVVKQLTLLVRDFAKDFGSLAGHSELAPLIGQIRTQLLPALMNLATGVSSSLGPAIVNLATAWVKFESSFSYQPFEAAVSIFAKLANAFTSMIGTVPGMGNLVATLMTMSLVWKGVGLAGKATGITKFLESATKDTGKVRTFTRALLGNTDALKKSKQEGSAVAKIGTAINTGWGKAVSGLKSGVKWLRETTVVQKLAAGASRALGAATRFMLGPWGIAIMIITALVVLFVELYKHNARFRAIVQAVAKAVVSFAKSAWSWIKKVAGIIWDGLVAAWHAVADVVKRVFGVVAAVIGFYIKIYIAIFKAWWFVVKTIFEIIGGLAVLLFKHVIAPAAKWLGGILTAIWHGIEAGARATWHGISVAATAVWHVIAGVAKWLWGVILAGAKYLWRGLVRDFHFIQAVGTAIWKPIAAAGKWLWGVLKAGFGVVRDFIVHNVWDPIKTAAADVFHGIVNNVVKPVVATMQRVFQGLGRAVGGIWSGIRDGFSAAMGGVRTVINGIITGINKLIDGINAVKLGANLPHIPYLSSGGAGTSQGTMYSNRVGGYGSFFTGGSPTVGALSLVGELGPELFVRRDGGMQLVGAHGPEFTRFTSPGWVVPNPTTPASVAKPVPAWVTDSLERPAAPVATMERPVEAAPNLTLQFLGDGSALTPDDVERAALAAYRRYERERKERR